MNRAAFEAAACSGVGFVPRWLRGSPLCVRHGDALQCCTFMNARRLPARMGSAGGTRMKGNQLHTRCAVNGDLERHRQSIDVLSNVGVWSAEGLKDAHAHGAPHKSARSVTEGSRCQS